MNLSHVLLCSALMVPAAASQAADSELSKRITASDGWSGYSVPMVADAGVPCCYEWRGGQATKRDCSLESHSWSITTNDSDPHAQTSDRLSVYLHTTHGAIDKVRAFGEACRLSDGDRVRWLGNVSPAESITLLEHTAVAGTEDVDAPIAAAALHADGAATQALERLAAASSPSKVRQQALFWLAQARGVEGARIVEHVATTDPNADLRAETVFDLSQVHGLDGYASIHGIAQHDKSEHVREQALFWMAQMDDKRAKEDILTAIGGDTSDSVREQAVFALSQLKEGQGETALIALVRGNYPRKVKEQALFWLGQSGSDQAMRFIDEILEKHSGSTGS